MNSSESLPISISISTRTNSQLQKRVWGFECIACHTYRREGITAALTSPKPRPPTSTAGTRICPMLSRTRISSVNVSYGRHGSEAFVYIQTYCKVECSCHMLLLDGDAKHAGLCRCRGRRVWCVGSHDGFDSPRGYSQGKQGKSTSDVSRLLKIHCRDSSRFVQLQYIRTGRHSCIVANRVGCAGHAQTGTRRSPFWW